MTHPHGVVILVGPTAVGKTRLSVELASAFDGEIVSADSMQIYKGMDIGTAKITPAEARGIPHWGINILEPDESFSVSAYREKALNWFTEIWERGHLPFLVGGTGLYVRAATESYNFTDHGGDPQFRAELEKKALEEGAETVHSLLKQVDPETANRLHPNDLRRVIRALEVYQFTGKRISEQAASSGKTQFPTLKLGLTMRDRQLLYQRINQRVDAMIEADLVGEVENLLQRGIQKNLISMQGIGYKEIIDYIQGRLSLEEAIEQIKLGSRRYAKRQLSWFRRDPHIHWFEVDTMSWETLYEATFRLVKEFKHQLSNNVQLKEDGGTIS